MPSRPTKAVGGTQISPRDLVSPLIEAITKAAGGNQQYNHVAMWLRAGVGPGVAWQRQAKCFDTVPYKIKLCRLLDGSAKNIFVALLACNEST